MIESQLVLTYISVSCSFMISCFSENTFVRNFRKSVRKFFVGSFFCRNFSLRRFSNMSSHGCSKLCSNNVAPFTLIRFHFNAFLFLKTELFSSPFTLLRFQIKTDIFQQVQVFTHVPKNALDCLLWKTRLARLVLQIPPLCLAPFSFSSVLVSVFKLRFWGGLMEVNISVFMQKRISVNRTSEL